MMMAFSKRAGILAVASLGVAAFGVYTIAKAGDPKTTTPAAETSEGSSSRIIGNTPTGTIRAEGRVATYPGGQVHLATETGGRIAKLLVQEQQFVKRGTVIAEIAAEEERAALAEARARIVEADADIAFLTTELERASRLSKTNSIPRQGLDKANRDLEAARARRAIAVATVQRIEAMLAKTRIVAPIDGMIIGRYVEEGETVPYGTRLVTIADLTKRRIDAEIDEYDVGRIQLGDSVRIWAEGYEDQRWTGVVEMIPDVVAQRRLEPNDPGRALDTRVLHVKVTLPDESPLKLGQRVEIEVIPQKN
jgi:HlyD family secretion protein